MVRATSIATYNNIKESGLLSELRFKVYDIIYKHGPITISQMIRIASTQVTNTGSYTGRISELEEMGVITPAYVGPCPVTGNVVLLWVTTDNLPGNLPKRLTKRQKKKKVVDNIRAILKLLEGRDKSVEKELIVPLIKDLIDKVHEI